MNPEDTNDEHYIDGCHGTLAEQKDEAFYDDRSDASDDLEKGRLKFPSNLYGRDHELETLCNIYDSLNSSLAGVNNIILEDDSGIEDDEGGEKECWSPALSDPYDASRVVFIAGYCGVGKSSLVNEFIKQIQTKYISSGDSPVLHICGKFEQGTSAAPFSAIAAMLESLATDLCRTDENETCPINHQSSGRLKRMSMIASHNSLAGSGFSKDHFLGTVMSRIANYRTKAWSNIGASELIGPGTEGDAILRMTFPALAPLLDSCTCSSQARRDSISSIHPTLNGIKECTRELLSAIGDALDHPLILYLDDVQWGDGASIDMMSYLLKNTLRGIMFICSYRSNEIDEDHALTNLMDSVTASRSSEESSPSVESIDLYSLSPEVIKKYIADCVKKEDAEEVGDLAEAVYTKTMGNIFFVKQALEALVRKNSLFYDVMTFEWSWSVSTVELANYISDDVVMTVKEKILSLENSIQSLLVVMAYIPNSLDVSVLTRLMSDKSTLEESEIVHLLKEASNEGMLIVSIESGHYVFAHDNIRQASLELATEVTPDWEGLMYRLSTVLLKMSRNPETEWCLYVALGLLDNLPPDKTDRSELIKLSLKASQIARKRGSLAKENELLPVGLKVLEASGIMWKDYALTLDMYNAVIISDATLGAYDKAREAIAEVLKNARTLEDKFVAYMHQLKCDCAESRDYDTAAENGVKILNLYGCDIQSPPRKSSMLKEGMKLKLALRNRSYASLNDLPVVETPMAELFYNVIRWAQFSKKDELLRLLAWKAIRAAFKRGIDKHLPPMMAWHGALLAKEGMVNTSFELGQTVMLLSEKFNNDKEIYALARQTACFGIISQIESFRSIMPVLLESNNYLKMVGNVEAGLGCILCYFQAYFAAGLELGPIIEGKVQLAERYASDMGIPSFFTLFQMYRQFALNLRKKTENPTVFNGEAYNEEHYFRRSTMGINAMSMSIRDSCSHRLHLAFIFCDDHCMAQMLSKLADFPITDHVVPRIHNRLCFMGLAAFSLGSKQFRKLGQKCLCHFENLSKHGSKNAKPVHLLMLAMKRPSRKSFEEAINACVESNVKHMEAMSNERYALFLYQENDETLAKDHITSAYWLYRGWGAHNKALRLKRDYEFLKDLKREPGQSASQIHSKIEPGQSASHNPVPKSRGSKLAMYYNFNTTLKSTRMVMK